MHIVNIDKAIVLLQQRKNLLTMQLSVCDSPDKIEIKIEGKAHEFPATELIHPVGEAIKSQLAANAKELEAQGCIIKE